MTQQEILESKTIPELFYRRCEATPDALAYRQEYDGKWHEATYAEYGRTVGAVTAALRERGFNKGDHVAIWADTTAEWTIMDLAAMAVGGVAVGIFQTLTPEQAAYILNDCQAKAIAVDSPERLEGARQLKSMAPSLETIILMLGNAEGDDFVRLEDLVKQGEGILAKDPDAYVRCVREVQPEDTCTLIYTSGTTGEPKGAIHSHSGAAFTSLQTYHGVGLTTEDSTVSFLPMSHVAEHFCAFIVRLYAGSSTSFCPDVLKVAEVIRMASPTYVGGVPRVFEKVYSKVMAGVAAAPPKKQKLFHWALNMGKQKLSMNGTAPGFVFMLKYRLADKLVLSKIRAALGGRVRFIVCGAAPIDPEIIEFFYAIGIPFLEAYGMTESGGISHGNNLDGFKIGTVGRCVEGFECKLAEDGEILVRGPGLFKGYLNKPEQTAEALDEEGWLHTGDIGEVDADGYYRITDRKKNIIVTANGKNVAPAPIEMMIGSEPLVSQVVVIGDKRKYLVALVTLSEEQLKEYASRHGVSLEEAHDSAEVKAAIKLAVDAANKNLARYEQIKDFRILPREFSLEEDEMTPTMKLKRRVISDHFQEEIDSMYAVEVEA
jgi:long-chain acyl-CoA synthetase